MALQDSSSIAHAKTEIGLIGLGVMGQMLSLNIASKGFRISVFNRTEQKVDDTLARASEEQLSPFMLGFKDLSDFVSSIHKPRTILILVQAGNPVDAVLRQLTPFLEPGDCVADCGNSLFSDTEERSRQLVAQGLLYLGMGVSGGEEGARYGPSMMPGGSIDGYERISQILTRISAQLDDGSSCVTFVGEGGSGHYVKMVHNGIEYGDMQLIAETYHILKNIGKFTNSDIADTFHSWNKSSELDSFLIEITADIFTMKDPMIENSFLIDAILDKSGSKGTGRWTVQQAAEQGIAVPTIAAALDARYLSSFIDERKNANLTFPNTEHLTLDNNSKRDFAQTVKYALYAAKICCYAQGFKLIQEMSRTKNWNLNLKELARIWKGGCIIRAVFLDKIAAAYDINPDISNLMLDRNFANELIQCQLQLRQIIKYGIDFHIPLPAFSASLSYFDTYKTTRLPANLIQAQRDYFGSHTYERLDREGVFHTKWKET